MSVRLRGNFFDRKRMLLAVAFGILVFFLSYLCLLLLIPHNQAYELNDITYTYSSRQAANTSPTGSWTKIEQLEDVKKNSDSKYLVIKALVPPLEQGKLYIHSFNGTACVSLNGEVLFDNMKEKKLSGSSYIEVLLPEGFAGKSIEIVLYSPFSDSLDICVIPPEESIFTITRLPYAGIIICVFLFIMLAASGILCFITRHEKDQIANYMLMVALAICMFLMVLEYTDLLGYKNFLFHIKICLILILPILGMLELTIRYSIWTSFIEALLSINILYVICVAFLGGNVFFISLLRTGIILQIANAVCMVGVLTKQSENIRNSYLAATIIFWIFDIFYWYALLVQKLSWQLLALSFSVALDCLISGIGSVSLYIKQVPAVIRDMEPQAGNREINAAVSEGKAKEQLSNTDSIYPVDLAQNVDSINEMEKYLPALNAINELILKKVYGRDRHSLNVAEYTFFICEAMGMSEQAAKNISEAAALHDIGKICVPEQILLKSRKLSEHEFSEIRKHNVYGFQLLNSESDPFFKMAALIAKEHHEHMDGSGYMGLKGDEISLPARVVAVADVFDALVSTRSYKVPWDFDKAVDYVCEHCDDYYDKDVVEAFVSAKKRIYNSYKSHK